MSRSSPRADVLNCLQACCRRCPGNLALHGGAAVRRAGQLSMQLPGSETMYRVSQHPEQGEGWGLQAYPTQPVHFETTACTLFG